MEHPYAVIGRADEGQRGVTPPPPACFVINAGGDRADTDKAWLIGHCGRKDP